MKLSRKILKFTEPLTYRRGWRRAQRSIFRVPLRPMLAQIDWDRAREIQQRYANSTAGYAKYADIEPWLRLNRERVQDLNLHRSEPKRVLDLGCGGGFFLFILKNLGHSVMGLDIDRVPLFGELLELFGVRASRLQDRRFRAAAGPRSTIRLDHGVLGELLPLSSGEETLGNSGMGFLSARFTASPGAGRKNLFWTQSLLQRRLLHA